jgi:hypothetical protein
MVFIGRQTLLGMSNEERKMDLAWPSAGDARNACKILIRNVI